MDSLIGVTLPYYHITILQYHNMPSTFYYIKNVELEQYCNEYIWPRYFFSTPVWRILITIKMNFRYVGVSPRDMMPVLPTLDQWWVPFHTSLVSVRAYCLQFLSTPAWCILIIIKMNLASLGIGVTKITWRHKKEFDLSSLTLPSN